MAHFTATHRINWNGLIKTMAVLTNESTADYERLENLEKDFKLGHYAWFPVKCQSDRKRNSYLIFNIPLENALYLGKRFGQGSVVFIDGSHFECWVRSRNGEYAKINERRMGQRFDLANAESYFTHISSAFMFQNPFFDGSDENRGMMGESAKYVCEIISKHTATTDEAQRRIQNCIEAKSGYNRFCNRGELYSNCFQW